jgi:hypothetical protein
MNKPKLKTTAILVKNIPANVKAQYHAHCIKKGTSMTQDIIDHMKHTILKAKGQY